MSGYERPRLRGGQSRPECASAASAVPFAMTGIHLIDLRCREPSSTMNPGGIFGGSWDCRRDCSQGRASPVLRICRLGVTHRCPKASRGEPRRPRTCRHSVRTLVSATPLVKFQVSSFLTALVLSFRPLVFPTSANRPLDSFHGSAGGDCCWTCSSHGPRRCRWRLRGVLFPIG